MNVLQDPSKKDIGKMFDRIAGTYDPINRLLSLGLDIGWRKRMAQLLPLKGEMDMLDIATGTADQILYLCRRHISQMNRAVGVDISNKMLEIGRIKVENEQLRHILSLEHGDATSLNFSDGTFDATTISFGIRNVPDVPKALSEMHRVLRKDGKALILEFSMPRNPVVKLGNLMYLRFIVPWIGGRISGDKEAYRYLNTSIESFPYGQDFCTLLENAGFRDIKFHPLTFGIATLYEGTK
jgi:demethylmenaquinone methyltransferase/2-methoxy-6-polyprenyl-1,4-benzoquinol methylase